MVLETEFEWMENSRGKPGGPNTTGWAREPPQLPAAQSSGNTDESSNIHYFGAPIMFKKFFRSSAKLKVTSYHIAYFILVFHISCCVFVFSQDV